jgi:hypothetical protein
MWAAIPPIFVLFFGVEFARPPWPTRSRNLAHLDINNPTFGGIRPSDHDDRRKTLSATDYAMLDEGE